MMVQGPQTIVGIVLGTTRIEYLGAVGCVLAPSWGYNILLPRPVPRVPVQKPCIPIVGNSGPSGSFQKQGAPMYTQTAGLSLIIRGAYKKDPEINAVPLLAPTSS